MTEINRPIVNRFSDAQAVAIAAADAFVNKAIELLAVKSEIHISITGGTVGILTLKMIGEHDQVEQIDWDRVNIWWGDERFVDSDSPDRNANQAADALLERVDATRLHEFPAADEGLSLDDAARVIGALKARFPLPDFEDHGDPRQDFGGMKGLEDNIIGADFQAYDLVDFGIFSSQHDDWH